MPLVDLLGPLLDFDSVGQATPFNPPKHSPSSGEFQLDPDFIFRTLYWLKTGMQPIFTPIYKYIDTTIPLFELQIRDVIRKHADLTLHCVPMLCWVPFFT